MSLLITFFRIRVLSKKRLLSKEIRTKNNLNISFSSVNIFWFVFFVLLWSWSADTYEAGFFKANRLQTH
jgi:hypothetical protein